METTSKRVYKYSLLVLRISDFEHRLAVRLEAPLTFSRNTIARDVLASSGRGSPGLNHHLLPLLENFTCVDEDSDLATIRWDLVGARESSLVC